jgi:hypothetical protein
LRQFDSNLGQGAAPHDISQFTVCNARPGDVTFMLCYPLIRPGDVIHVVLSFDSSRCASRHAAIVSRSSLQRRGTLRGAPRVLPSFPRHTYSCSFMNSRGRTSRSAGDTVRAPHTSSPYRWSAAPPVGGPRVKKDRTCEAGQRSAK